MPTVHIPGIGNVPRAGVIGGIVIGGAGIVYFVIKHRQNAATATPAAGGYGAGYGAYGAGYGSGYGYGTAGFAAGEAYGLGIATAAYGSGVAGYGGGYGGGYGTTVPPSGGITSNAQWLVDAEAALDSSHNPATVSAALGKYLAGGTLTSDQAQIVSLAIAAVGDPPVPGANGFPPGVHSGPPGGQSNPKPGSGTGKEVPGTHRHAATGATSLNAWSKTNKTTAGEVTNATEANYNSGYMTRAHHTAFDIYLNKGTASKMPTGLVFFSTK